MALKYLMAGILGGFIASGGASGQTLPRPASSDQVVLESLVESIMHRNLELLRQQRELESVRAEAAKRDAWWADYLKGVANQPTPKDGVAREPE